MSSRGQRGQRAPRTPGPYLKRTLRAKETTEKQLEELGAWPKDSDKEPFNPLLAKQEEATQVPCNVSAPPASRVGSLRWSREAGSPGYGRLSHSSTTGICASPRSQRWEMSLSHCPTALESPGHPVGGPGLISAWTLSG